MFARAAASVFRQSLRRQAPLATRALSTSARPSPAKTFGTAAALAAAATFSYTLYTMQSPVSADTTVPVHGVPGSAKERSFIAVKPDGVQRGLIGEIISRFEKRGYKLVGLKLLVPSQELAQQHYADLSSKPFFAGLVDYMTNGKAPVIGMVWEGPAVIKQARMMLGATDPNAAGPGTIRGDFCLSIGRNIIHASDSAESAQKEIGMWFGGEGEVVSWTSSNEEWVVSDN